MGVRNHRRMQEQPHDLSALPPLSCSVDSEALSSEEKPVTTRMPTSDVYELPSVNQTPRRDEVNITSHTSLLSMEISTFFLQTWIDAFFSLRTAALWKGEEPACEIEMPWLDDHSSRGLSWQPAVSDKSSDDGYPQLSFSFFFLVFRDRVSL